MTKRYYSGKTGTTYIKGFHPVIPDDAVEIDEETFALLFSRPLPSGKIIQPSASGYPELKDYVAPPPTLEQVQNSKTALVQSHLDKKAESMGYDSIASAITYADEPAVAKFQAEGQALRAWRSLVWAACYAILDDVNAGKRPVPSDADLLAALPEFSL